MVFRALSMMAWREQHEMQSADVQLNRFVTNLLGNFKKQLLTLLNTCSAAVRHCFDEPRIDFFWITERLATFIVAGGSFCRGSSFVHFTCLNSVMTDVTFGAWLNTQKHGADSERSGTGERRRTRR